MNILEIHTKFRRYCAFEEQLSPNTIKAFKIAVGAFVKRTGVESISDITLDVLRGFFYEGMEKYQWSYSSFVNYHKYLKKFLEWCVKEGYLKDNPILEIKKPKKPKNLPRRLRFEEAQRILQVALNYNWRYEFEHSRNYAIMAVFLFAGLRCKELLNLLVTDINLDAGNILIRQGKGDKDRNVPIHSKLKYILKHYLEDRRRLGKISEYLFVGVQSDLKLRYKNISEICKKISIESGVKFTPHCLRHTFGSVAVEQGIGLVQLKDIMGHSDISSTMIYTSMSSKTLHDSLNRVDLF